MVARPRWRKVVTVVTILCVAFLLYIFGKSVAYGDTMEPLFQGSSAWNVTVDYDVHVFYYVWYGNPQHDGKYFHWSHSILPHWNPLIAIKWPRGRRTAPEDIGANFYPQLDCYSSIDPAVLKQHMLWIRQAGIGTIVVSWYPPGKSDTEGVPRDGFMRTLLDEARKHELKVAFLIEPYPERTVNSIRNDIEYVVSSYGGHDAFYRYTGKPMFYVYDSYLIDREDWRTLLKKESSNSIRGSKYDSVILALVVEQTDASNVLFSGFDGFFTYFASTGFSYGSTPTNWPLLTRFARQHNLITSFSVGPGYMDERIRPWNHANSRSRENGKYYKNMWKAAVEAESMLISITSFNEWHEGTQIEPAKVYNRSGYMYMNYEPMGPNYYIDLTRWLVEEKNHNQTIPGN